MADSTIGSGLDYATLTLWEADTDNDLVTATESEYAVLNTTDSPYTMGDFDTIAGATVNATYHRGIKAASGQATDGTPGSGPIITEATSGFACLWINEAYFTVQDVEFDGQDTAGAIFFYISNAGQVIERCIGYDLAGTAPVAQNFGGTAVDSALTLRNCAFWNDGSTAGERVTGASGNTDAVVIDHCTFVHKESTAAFGGGAARYCLVYNSYAGNYGGSAGWTCWLDLDAGSEGYAASDTSGETASHDSLAVADQFVGATDAGGWDLHLKSGSDLEGLGGTTSGLTTDIDGDTRDGTTPDVGFDEFVAAGGATTGNLLAMMGCG